MKLSLCIEQIQEKLKRGEFQNEAAVSQGIVLKVLNVLGWDTYDTQIVAPEYSVGGRRVDYALCYPATKPTIFIEVKQVGRSDGADKQLFEYAFHEGIPLAILTDGQEWHFYLPSGQGVYSERKFYFLDLLGKDRSIEEICHRLERYVSYARVKSGEARNDANSDLQDKSKQQEAQRILPKAWHALLAEPEGLLVDLLSGKAEEICGVKPKKEAVEDFLHSQIGIATQQVISDAKNSSLVVTAKVLSRMSPQRPSPEQPVDIGYQLNGQWHSYPNGIDVMLAILREFAQMDKTFLSRFSSRKHGKKRRWVDQNKQHLYPDRQDLQDKYSEQLIAGWWVGTNYSATSDMPKIIEAACEVMGIKFGSELQAKFR